MVAGPEPLAPLVALARSMVGTVALAVALHRAALAALHRKGRLVALVRPRALHSAVGAGVETPELGLLVQARPVAQAETERLRLQILAVLLTLAEAGAVPSPDQRLQAGPGAAVLVGLGLAALLEQLTLGALVADQGRALLTKLAGLAAPAL